MNYVYILYSSKLNKYYVGFTTISVEERLRKHLSNHSGYTSRAKDWEIVYTEEYITKEEAIKREKEIKNWKSSLKIKELISNN
jgi:putative endonuclease